MSVAREPTDENRTSPRLIWESSAYRAYFLGMLVLSYLVNFMDRQVFSILLEPIKRELLLADWQLGALGGLAFATFYVVLGLPIAKLSDRYNRINIIAVALSCWSLATAACGMASNFVQMLLARIGVAVGEAGGTPPSYSLISDLFPPSRRATATGIYVAGPPVGTALGLVLGGWLAEEYGWRVAFVAVGLPGLLLAGWMWLTLREPPRGFSEQRDAEGEASTVFGVARLLLSRRSFPLMSVASGIAAFSGYAMGLWLPSFYIRSYGLSVAEAGLWLAVGGVINGIVGAILGGYVADNLGKRNIRWWVYVPGIAMLIGGLLCFPAFSTGSWILSMVIVNIVLMLYHTWAGPVYAATQGMVGLRMRAVAVSLLLFVVNLIGLGFGPLVVGIVSDVLQEAVGDDSLRWSLMLTGPVFLIASVLYFFSAKTLRADMEAAPR